MPQAEESETMLGHEVICPTCGEHITCDDCPVLTREEELEAEKAELLAKIDELDTKVFNLREAVLGWSPGVENFLITVVDEKDTYTHKHSERVTQLSLLIGGVIGLNHEALNTLKKAARLHDIGKLCVPEHILKKPGKLTPEEYERVKQHSEKGALFLSNMAFYKEVAEIVLHHHEKWDGTGYPTGLQGQDIPLLARIIAVADTIDAMSLDRIYREGKGRESILQELRVHAGKQFDPEIVWAVINAQIDLR